MYEPAASMILPFGALLTAIALAPLFFADSWGRHYPKVALALATVTVGYYLLALPAPAHVKVGETAREYFSFIALIGSLFVVSGGVHIHVKGKATPQANVLFLLVGAIVANLLGTTGASMLLIRPWIRLNKGRITAHHIVFFIFIVSNVGGCLTPIGDPPLFLGYLNGVPFWWVAAKCWPIWLAGVGTLLAMFYAVDRRHYRQAEQSDHSQSAEPSSNWRFDGLSNLIFLGLILGAVFINRPPFLREAVMIGAALGSWFTTKKTIHEANLFHWNPLKEVAILFIGIFATMMPALDWLEGNARRLHHAPPDLFYWSSGALSSVLDNAPTYLTFLSAAIGKFVPGEAIHQIEQALAYGPSDPANLSGPHAEPMRNTLAALRRYHPGEFASGKITREEIKICYLLGNLSLQQFIIAISVGSVFFGANTYIGNGPNFMVKSIADHQHVHTPAFMAYVFKFTLPFMVPMLALVWLLFF
jgi:Na+/H+ antiporter NhaD/arsenite permease-like protein